MAREDASPGGDATSTDGSPGSAEDVAASSQDGDGVDVQSVGDSASDGSPPDSCQAVALPPSVNVDSTAWPFATSPTWNCTASGTTTIDSAAGTITSTSCALGTPDFTDGVAQTASGGPAVMVVRLRGLTITNGHRVVLQGDKPVVFLVAGNVLIDSGGQIDASATGATPGPGGQAPGASSGSCGASTGANGSYAAGYSGGGGGGGFGTAGGQGGSAGGAPSSGGGAGAVSSSTTLQPLRGGCAGGTGGSVDGTFGGSGGAGGGAFEISASGTITIGTGSNAATLSASGGGSPSTPRTGTKDPAGYIENGSGGGGSGGGVRLVSPASATFGTSGIVRVHGGGSAGGYHDLASNATAPGSGQDGHQTDDAPASGGAGAADGSGANGAVGGLSSAATTSKSSAAGAAGAGNRASSGGGGGGGRIVIVVSPSTSSCP